MISSILFDHNRIKLEVYKKYLKSLNIWKSVMCFEVICESSKKSRGKLENILNEMKVKLCEI